LAGCISADAGYQDVRQLTSARIQKDVRWYEHESSEPRQQQTRELLRKPLDAEAAVQIALLNNEGLQAAFEELGVSRARWARALRLPNPTLDGQLRYHTSGGMRPSIDVQGLIDLTDLIFLPVRSGAASAELDAAKLSVTGRVLDLALEARVAFYDYQAAAQSLELSNSVLLALRASFEAAERLHEAGNITDLNLANERALYEEARVEHARAEALLASRREALNAVLGLWGEGTQWTADEHLAEPKAVAQLDQLERRAIEQSLDLSLIRRRFEAAAKRANLTRARGWVPELRAGVAAEREHDDFGWTLGPALQLELPLFYQGQGETGEALAEARREQKRYNDTAIRVRATARGLATQLETAAKSAAYYKEVLLPLRQQVLDQTQLEYNAMGASVFQLLQAKRDQIQAGRRYVELLAEYWVLQARVDLLLAGRLPMAGGDIGTSAINGSAGGGATEESH
jgi:cobalt-zinc-cadmium efflux system outer membrane protein